MAAIHETAYPRLKSSYSEEELTLTYTPTEKEVTWASQRARDESTQLALLTLLKVFQHLGYFVLWHHIPNEISIHIARCVGQLFVSEVMKGYDQAGTRFRHMKLIRKYLRVQPVGEATYQSMRQAALQAAQTKEHLADIINAMLEELIKERLELPAFSKFVREARRARGKVNQQCYQTIFDQLRPNQKQLLDELLFQQHRLIMQDVHQQPPITSLWDQLKQEPAKPTSSHIRAYLSYVTWLKSFTDPLAVTINIPVAKQEQFYYEAYAANLTDMRRFSPAKRYTFAVVLLQRKLAKTLDDLVSIFTKLMQHLHSKGKSELEVYHTQQRERTNQLVSYLADITEAYQQEGSTLERWKAVDAAMPEHPDQVHQQCQQHLAYAENNYYLCLLPLYRKKRSLLFDCVASLQLRSSSHDRTLIEAIGFILWHRNGRKEWISRQKHDLPDDLRWIPDKWRKLVTGKGSKEAPVEQLHRKYFELCVFSELMRQLKSGDIFVIASQEFDDYRKNLISWRQHQEMLPRYEILMGIQTEKKAFVQQMKDWLLETAQKVDAAFPVNEYVRIEHGQIVIGKNPSKKPLDDYAKMDQWLKGRMQPTNILEVMIRTEKWLNVSQYFHALSGYESRIDNYPERLITTLFCYGCNLGPAQTARSVEGINRKQLAWVNAHHVTEERLNKAITQVVNTYNQFVLPRYWGSGKSASADGTKWNLYEQNLLSEYHIRYGGYGGIGYYHISDTYIALFSHFIPCGVYEAVYILDGLINNASDIQPDTLHGDTQAQNTAVFGLARLLGIKLMPRIRNLKDLILFRPDKNTHFQHIDALFSESIDWSLIQRHLPDMLRVVLSIQAGKIAPSTILRRLGTYSRKNKLYFAFRELGRVVRMAFLLNYFHDANLRQTIQAATTKSEEFHEFTKWIAFGHQGTITENLRHEQRKVIKYNHLVANLLILYNVDEMTRVIQELLKEGHYVNEEVLPLLSPYRREHINRFGSYTLDMDQEVTPLRVAAKLF